MVLPDICGRVAAILPRTIIPQLFEEDAMAATGTFFTVHRRFQRRILTDSIRVVDGKMLGAVAAG